MRGGGEYLSSNSGFSASWRERAEGGGCTRRRVAGGATRRPVNRERERQTDKKCYNNDMVYHNKKFAFTLAEGATHVALLDNFRKAAFTLAEVLITLGIIGVVAAMTLPTLISDYKTKVTVNRLSSTYSILSNAFNLMISENGVITDYGNNDTERVYKLLELLPKYLQTAKVCNLALQDKCVKTSHKMRVRDTGHSFISGDPAIVLKNGALVAIALSQRGGNCLQNKNLDYGWINSSTYAERCAVLWIDVNGASPPNIYDIDTFKFLIYSDGIVPAGRDKYDGKFATNCIDDGTSQGYDGECSAWVLHNKNMDYLYCPDKLGWNKASSCKEP